MQKLSYTKLQPFKSSNTRDKLTNEQRFWKKYETTLLQTLTSTPAAISSNGNPNDYVVYANARSVVIYDPSKRQIVKEVSSFTEVVTAVCLRPDGAVMAIAEENGAIQVMDTKQKFHLRTFKNNKKKVNALEYIDNDLYSGGDDFILRHFDVAAGEVVHSYDKAHSDYITSIKALENNHILSAGYDGFIRLFDFRVHEKAQLEFHHVQPLEGIELFPSKMTFIACGGNKVSLWDVRTGKQLFSACNNKKTVSAVKIVSNGSRFMTSSYDQYLKVYKSDTFQLTYQDKLAGPISCFDVTKSGQHIFIGLEGGRLLTKSRANKSDVETGDSQEQNDQDEILQWMKKNEQKKFAYNDQYFYRGIYEKASSYDIKFEQNQNKKVNQYDSFLKKFQYKEALLTVLQKKNMMIYLALVDQFIQRGCLERTVASMTDVEIVKMLEYLLPLLHNQKYYKPSVHLLQKLLEQHPKPAPWKNDVLAHLNSELESISLLSTLDGMLELVEYNFQ